MSWNFAVEKINLSLDRLANWYRDFMHRTEISFRALHERIMYLEQRQAWKGPTDEQVERILRKIMAERFADAGVQRVVNPNIMKDGAYFVENPSEPTIPHSIPIDVTSLHVDPQGVPSKLYGETLQMLENRLEGFPRLEYDGTRRNDEDDDEDDDEDIKDAPDEFKKPTLPPTYHRHSSPRTR